ncbi:hypothetical protein KP509_23G000100 [Ceratopteris richardii]|uniref:Histone H2A n=1 Tax=Ceratopteris richardii TaxID=49495 RepID=A0A8T2RYB4_CERRI|nr:hypothetical protein KP509_23G000100 [Ceratopteris richardii]
MESAKGGKSGRSKVARKKGVSKTIKDGLQFLVRRLARYLKKGCYAKRVGTASPVYLAATLEYLVAEKNRIIHHIQLAIRNDEELGKLLSGVTIAYDSVLPNILQVLLHKKTSSTRKMSAKPSKASKSPKKVSA